MIRRLKRATKSEQSKRRARGTAGKRALRRGIRRFWWDATAALRAVGALS